MSDPTTQSNYLQIATEHVLFNWSVDFQTKIIEGSALHDLYVKEDDVQEVIFDTADLDISHVQVQGNVVKHTIKPKHVVMGSALHIPLPSGLKVGSSVQVAVFYKTTENCTALQWLDKEQTQGKTFPFLFSQCQPIYARALAPLQDTPSVKIKYTGTVSSVLPVLLSAIRTSPPADGPPHDGKTVGKDVVTYTYHQPIAIPSYLIAIASGDVVYRPFPQYEDKEWKTGIWAEPQMIDAAYWEFSEDTARFLAEEEKIVTPYKFGVYDLLVLPPSFPYGGMENACLTFLTPTLVTGDRTLVDVVAHEITHSYFGNGVTHSHASHFWLNEGWTVYIERLLLERLYSPAHRGFSFLVGRKALQDDLERYQTQPKYQRLMIDFEKGEDPDDAYSRVPYEKGANLILHLERTLGGLDVFLPYVRNYVETYTGKSITTEQWKSHLYAYYIQQSDKIEALDAIDWNAWLYGEGLSLPVEQEYDTSLATKAYELAGRWDVSRSNTDITKSNFQSGDLGDFTSSQIVIFLERLQQYEPLPSDHIVHLASTYTLSTTVNAEVRLRFYQVALSDPEAPAAKQFGPEAVKWVTGEDTGMVVGRMKFCRPIFKLVYKVDEELAVTAFGKAKNAFHPIARNLIEKDLRLV